MKYNIFSLAAVIGAMLLGSASCVKINEQLGDNFIPTEQIWDVYPCADATLSDITMKQSDRLTGYNTSRITFGAIKDDKFSSKKSSCFTLVTLLRG